MKRPKSYFERELRRGLLACVARFSIGLTGLIWPGHGEMYFCDDDFPSARWVTLPSGETGISRRVEETNGRE